MAVEQVFCFGGKIHGFTDLCFPETVLYLAAGICHIPGTGCRQDGYGSGPCRQSACLVLFLSLHQFIVRTPDQCRRKTRYFHTASFFFPFAQIAGQRFSGTHFCAFLSIRINARNTFFQQHLRNDFSRLPIDQYCQNILQGMCLHELTDFPCHPAGRRSIFRTDDDQLLTVVQCLGNIL